MTAAAPTLLEVGGASVVETMRALLDAPDETTQSFLLAAVYCRAIRTGDSPRAVAETLFKALPDDHAWPPLEAALAEILGDEGEPGPP